MENITQTLHFSKKVTAMDKIKQIYIYKKTADINQINDKHILRTNIIFEAILRGESLIT
jgi:hypothetical protein